MSDQHAAWCRAQAFNHSDAARRVADEHNLHRVVLGYDAIGKWIACALSDGRSDHVLYDNRRDAVRHQHHEENWYTYIKIQPATINGCEAEVMLKTARTAYDNGMRMADPEDRHGGKDIIKRVTVEDMRAQAMGYSTNLILPNGKEHR